MCVSISSGGVALSGSAINIQWGYPFYSKQTWCSQGSSTNSVIISYYTESSSSQIGTILSPMPKQLELGSLNIDKMLFSLVHNKNLSDHSHITVVFQYFHFLLSKFYMYAGPHIDILPPAHHRGQYICILPD